MPCPSRGDHQQSNAAKISSDGGRTVGVARYDTPRAATVMAAGPCRLWAITRIDCKAVLQDIQNKDMRTRVRFLRKVKMGRGDDAISLGELLTDPELAQIAVELETESYHAGEIIVRQGQPGNHFYILEKGVVDVHRNDPKSGRRASLILGDNKIKEITPGGYFGELALINEEPRAASIRANEEVTVLTLSRDDFVKHLGPLQDLIGSAHEAKKTGKLLCGDQTSRCIFFCAQRGAGVLLNISAKFGRISSPD